MLDGGIILFSTLILYELVCSICDKEKRLKSKTLECKSSEKDKDTTSYGAWEHKLSHYVNYNDISKELEWEGYAEYCNSPCYVQLEKLAEIKSKRGYDSSLF